jgi:hypothetical protein
MVAGSMVNRVIVVEPHPPNQLKETLRQLPAVTQLVQIQLALVQQTARVIESNKS